MSLDIEDEEEEKPCPECGGELTFGYGLAGGGDIGGYLMCLDCDYFDKPGVDKEKAPICFPYGISPDEK